MSILGEQMMREEREATTGPNRAMQSEVAFERETGEYASLQCLHEQQHEQLHIKFINT